MKEKAAHPIAAMKQSIRVGRGVAEALPSEVPRLPMAYSKSESISGLGQCPQGLVSLVANCASQAQSQGLISLK